MWSMQAIPIFLGCFIDPISMLVITMPVLHPLLISLDFNLVWFGVLALFMGGFIPGIIIGLLMMVQVYFVALKLKLPLTPRPPARVMFTSFQRAILSLMTPAIIIGVAGKKSSHITCRVWDNFRVRPDIRTALQPEYGPFPAGRQACLTTPRVGCSMRPRVTHWQLWTSPSPGAESLVLCGKGTPSPTGGDFLFCRGHGKRSAPFR
jgi:hypothetical protein